LSRRIELGGAKPVTDFGEPGPEKLAAASYRGAIPHPDNKKDPSSVTTFRVFCIYLSYDDSLRILKEPPTEGVYL